MDGIESRYGSPFTFNRDLILNNEFLDLPCLQFNLTPDTVFMGKISKICLHNGYGFEIVDFVTGLVL